MIKQNKLMKGLFFALITAVISGFSIFYSKISVAKIDPLVLTTARNLVVGIVFITGIIIFGKLREITKLSRKEFVTLLIIGIIGGSIPFYLFFTGLQSVGAQNANIIHKSLFIWVSLLSFVFLKERFNRFGVVAFLLVFAGTYFFVPVNIIVTQGTLMVFAATILWSIENIIAKKILKTVSSEIVGLFRMGLGSLTLLTITVMSNKASILMHLEINQIVFIIVGSALLCAYVFFWYKSLKFAPASLVTMVLTFSVVVGNILNGSFAGMRLSTKDIYSSIVLGFGVIFLMMQDLKVFSNLRTQISRQIKSKM